jgi:hypothetical protein
MIHFRKATYYGVLVVNPSSSAFVFEHYAYHCGWVQLRPSDFDFQPELEARDWGTNLFE